MSKSPLYTCSELFARTRSLRRRILVTHLWKLLNHVDTTKVRLANQLQHDPTSLGGSCRRCGIRYSSTTAYIPCFEEGDTFDVWKAMLVHLGQFLIIYDREAHSLLNLIYDYCR